MAMELAVGPDGPVDGKFEFVAKEGNAAQFASYRDLIANRDVGCSRW